MPNDDKTKEFLEKLVAQLYERAALENSSATLNSSSYLIADDHQYLGKITTNNYDQNSITNEYGPYGSKYSATSVFNEYGVYGGQYGALSPRNPYCATPPKLFIGGHFKFYVSDNRYIADPRISYASFVHAIRHNVAALLRGDHPEELGGSGLVNDTYIEAQDGKFLGSLNQNPFDTQSIFNRFGSYGSKFSSDSIFNKFSPYGGTFSMQSPFNTTARRPPKIIKNGVVLGFVSSNPTITPRIAPEELAQWAKINVRKRF